MNETMLLAADALTPVADQVETAMKVCPVCHAQVFADMDTCFNCMYLFGSNQALEQKAAIKALPEVIPEPMAPKSQRSYEVEKRLGEGPSDPPMASVAEGGDLFAQFLVEFHGFLGEFLLNRAIDIKKL